MALQDCSKLLADGSIREGEGRQAATGPILLSRGACRLRFIALSHVRVAERPRALANVLRAWAPFNSPEWQLVPQAEGCLAIAWDADRVGAALSAAGWAGRRVLCETLVRAPLAEGLRLVEGIDGFEGQCWSGAKLLHSRWWRGRPDQGAWSELLRASGVGHGLRMDAEVPATVALGDAWLERPFARPKAAESFGSAAARWETICVSGCAVVLSLISGLQARQTVEAWQGMHAARQELDALKKDAEPVMALRQRVLASVSQLDRLSSQMSGPAPIEVLAHLSELLPTKGVVLREFDLSGLRVRAEFELEASMSRSMVIAALQRSPWFADISEARDALGRGAVPFEFRLRQAARPGSLTASPSPGSLPADPARVGPSVTAPQGR
jgi:hypothetical protein